MPLEDHVDYAPEEHHARVISGDPVAQSWEWISAYAKNLSGTDDGDHYEITAEELIETAMSHIESEDRWGGDYVSKGGLLEGIDTDPTFWDKLAILKGLDIPHDKRNNFFSCSC